MTFKETGIELLLPDQNDYSCLPSSRYMSPRIEHPAQSGCLALYLLLDQNQQLLRARTSRLINFGMASLSLPGLCVSNQLILSP